MTVGIVGLGIMGSAYSTNLLNAGVEVVGTDPATAARARLGTEGGKAYETLGHWLSECDLIIISVASPKVLDEITKTLGKILRPGQIVLETGTFAMADKLAAQANVQAEGAILLDTPISETRQQAALADLVIMASGPQDAIDYAKPYLAHLSHTVIDAGAFGSGSKLKYVANHAVALHNCAAAESLHYANILGLEHDIVYSLLSKGAGQSKMSDLRMPLMISGNYLPATAHMTMFKKDLNIIGADIRAQNISTPMFDAVNDLYDKGWTLLPKEYDTAAVFGVYRDIEKDK
jgi:L-threonate 2-dehydrogenase